MATDRLPLSSLRHGYMRSYADDGAARRSRCWTRCGSSDTFYHCKRLLSGTDETTHPLSTARNLRDVDQRDRARLLANDIVSGPFSSSLELLSLESATTVTPD